LSVSKAISIARVPGLVPSGSMVMVGGFGLVGSPVHLLEALASSDVRDLTVISNNLGEPGLALGALLRNGQIRHAIGSYFTSNPEVVRAVQEGQLMAELLPQGTLVEAMRAGGAGLGGFFTPTAAGTALAGGRETRTIDGVPQVFQPALRADVALIKAERADALGNLTYRMTARNFNPLMATAARRVIAEVEEIVPVGALAPEEVVTPHLYVDHLVLTRTEASELGSSSGGMARGTPTLEQRRIIMRTLGELLPGDVVNLGIGLPTLLADVIGPDSGIVLHSENGLLGMGPAPAQGTGLDYPINAGKQLVTALPGAAYFDSASAFAMIRGGHVDVAVMGALQVDEHANLANWAVPGRPLLGVGGAMDLAQGARRLIAVFLHRTKEGHSRLVRECDLPVTAFGRVAVAITELGVFRFHEGRLVLEEIAAETTLDAVRACTEAGFEVSSTLGLMNGGTAYGA
jgi:3-oxoacid CoA-transferase